MSFSAKASVVGNPDFKIIDIDIKEVAKAFSAYLKRGSSLTGVSLDEISTSVTDLTGLGGEPTLTELISKGMRIFDAVVWLSAGRPTSHPLTVDNAMTEDQIPSMSEIAGAVFYAYFFLLTQARYPGVGNPQNLAQVPAFLTNILKLDKGQIHYARILASFTITKFDPKWIKNVDSKVLGQEAMSRFGLGVAGYRMFGPFKLYTPEKTVSAELQNAVKFATTIATSPATWSIHPVTRSPEVLTKRGNLNKNLGNLILEVYTDKQINEMVEAKVLYGKPTKEPAYRNYLTWSSDDDISGNDKIFRNA